MRGKDLLRELQRTVDELAVLNEIGKALTSSLDIGEVMHVILAKVSELLKPSNWSLLLKDQATGELYFHAAVGAGSDRLLGMRLQPGEGIAGWVSQNNQPLLVKNVHADPRFASRFDKASRFHTKSILCVPLTFKDLTLGVIELVNGPNDGAFQEEDLRILGTVAEFSAIAIENARNFHKVQELTVLDDHTGLFNSRHLKRSLEQEVVRATRFGHPVSVIFFDLDHFKKVMADKPFGPVRLTASLGVAAFPDDARDPDNLIRRADESMYRVKAERRGGVFAAVSPGPDGRDPERSGTLTEVVPSDP